MASEKVMEIIRRWGYSSCRCVGKWNGYDVWAPVPGDISEIQYSGLPMFVLEDGEHVRSTPPLKGLEIARYFASQKNENDEQ